MGDRLRYHPNTGHILLGLVLLLWVFDGRPAFSEPVSNVNRIIEGVPFYPQEELGCGPAALASLLAYWGRPVSLEEITQEVSLKNLKGSLPMDLELAARRHGLAATSYTGSLSDLRLHLDKRQPVIAFLNLRWRIFPQGHFVVVTGYDEFHSEIVIHSGDAAYGRIPVASFLKAWARTGFWSLLVLPEEASS
jgi:ABC-type bacteriocin/lantibiotic exporter with double-glycine peptidase domain